MTPPQGVRRTFSGRRYRLGRRFDPIDVGAEGEEARLAFQLLIGVDYEDLDELVEVDRRWLQAKKAARHLGVEPPVRTDAATRTFFRQVSGSILRASAARRTADVMRSTRDRSRPPVAPVRGGPARSRTAAAGQPDGGPTEPSRCGGSPALLADQMP